MLKKNKNSNPMKKIIFFLFFPILLFSQSDYFLKKKYPNYEQILKQDFIQLEPKILTYSGTLSEIVGNKNKFKFSSKLKEKALLNRINYVINNSNIFYKTNMIDDGSNNSVINCTFFYTFYSLFYSNSIKKTAIITAKIRVKDFAYQIEVTDFNIGLNELQNYNYKNIIRYELVNTSKDSFDGLIKKELQFDWNNLFLEFNNIFSDFNNIIKENNNF